MKPLALIAAALLAIPAEAQEQPKMTFVEGMCAGVVLGLATGIVIVIGIRCVNKPPPPINQDTNAPAWIPLPPIDSTNAPPTNTIAGTIDAGEAAPLVDGSSWNIPGFTRGFSFAVEASDNGKDFVEIYRVRGWNGAAGQVVKVSNPDGTVLSVAFSETKTTSLMVPVTKGDKRFYRVRGL